MTMRMICTGGWHMEDPDPTGFWIQQQRKLNKNPLLIDDHEDYLCQRLAHGGSGSNLDPDPKTEKAK